MSIDEITERRGALSPAKQALLERLKRGGLTVAPVADVIRPRGDDGPAPLSPAQQRLWFLQRMEPESTAFVIPQTLRLRGAVDVAALDRAFAEIVRRHQVLRTVFQTRDGEPVQVVLPAPPSVLRVENAISADPVDEARRRMQSEAARRMDLEAGPLFFATLVRIAPADHILFVTLHHLVTDGWSLGLLYRELEALYGAFSRGEPSPLPPLGIQYADFAAWQRGHLAGPALEGQLAYWRQTLNGAPALLELPTDRPRPAVQGTAGAAHPVNYPRGLRERQAETARAEGSTLFMALMAGWAALLGGYARQDDVVLATAVAGRNREETEPLIGFFINTLPVRVDLRGDPSFRELLARVKEATVGALAHQDVPFERLVETLNVPRALSHSPVYQAMFTLQNAFGAPLALPGLTMERLGSTHASAAQDLWLALEEADGLEGMLQYATDLFDAATMERMIAHLAVLLDAATADPSLPLSRLPRMDAAERETVLRAWNATDADYEYAPVHETIAAQAARTPDAVAVSLDDESLAYAELDARANRLANRLRRLGVGPEVRVGLMLERAPEMVVAILAVLKAGGAYVPMDPGYPRERLAYMLADSRVPVLLTQDRLARLADGFTGTVLRLDTPEDDAEPQAIPYSLFPIPSPHGLAYVIYTSGSTGRPKGAMNTHRAIANRLAWMQAEYGLDARDAVLQKTPFSFDVSVWEFLWPLMTGARLVLARPEGHRDPAYLAELIRRERITTLHFVPSMLQAFLEQPALEERCTSVRRVVCSGEALGAELVERFHARMPSSAGLHNLYGPTEAAVDVTYWPCARGDERRCIPIGRPVSNTRMYVLDAHGNPTPIGVPGELQIAGVQVGRGYLDRPALTAEKFVPDPFSATGGARMYRTGDLARWTAEGVLEYLGRMDHQVKVRGFRIELGEIEAALADHPAVRDAVATVREDTPGDARIVAYVVPDGTAAPAPDELRRFLSRRLPDHMLPSAWTVMDALPLSPSGKVDRRALPAPEAPKRDAARFVPPRTPAEQRVAGFWREVLGVEQVGVDDNFFEIGGHSLLLARVHARVLAAFRREVSMLDLFRHTT
ncbi:MAG TPA: amino acid adenylation domain-containing protein, partial [Longimicrobium sp.]|nr:amino acid adenylation domain-containing protein [Longimicrobium sp.]